MPDMAFDFSAFPEEENSAPLKVMPFDFSAFPEDQNRVSPKEMPFDFSIFPEQPQPETVPYAGEDQGSQLSSYDPDSWINDKIPAAPAQPLFASVPRPPERLYRENAQQILQDIWNAASPEPTVGPLREHPLPPDQSALTLADSPTAAANDTSYLGSGANSQAAVLGEQGRPSINMLNIYKQWAIGGIDIILQTLYEASGALDIAIPYEPYQSPFSAPVGVNEQAARLWGSFELPELLGVLADVAGLFGGIPETTGIIVKSAEQLGQEGEAAVRAVYDIGPKVAIKIRNSTRTPDGLTSDVLSEIKNVGYQGFTSQVSDYSDIVELTDRRFDLYVRGPNAPGGKTRLSGPLQAEINKGRIHLKYIPGTE